MSERTPHGFDRTQHSFDRTLHPLGARATTPTVRTVLFTGLAVLACAGLAVIALGIGTVALPPPVVIDALLGIAHPTDVHIVRELRAPRILLAILVGAALGAAGTLLQSIGRNDLADPSLLGLTSGAALAHVLVTVLILPAVPALVIRLGPFAAAVGPLAAILGAAATLALTVTLARGAGGARLLLYGVVVGAVISSALSILLSVRGELLATIMRWVIGSLSASIWPDLLPVLLLGGAGALLVILALPGTVLVWLGEDHARTLGASPARTRALALAAVVALTAAAALGAGAISFIGLVAPHLARRLVGTHPVRVLPLATVLGGLVLLAADVIGQSLSLLPTTTGGGTALPVGAVTAVLGGPVLLVMLLRREKGER